MNIPITVNDKQAQLKDLTDIYIYIYIYTVMETAICNFI